MKRALLATLICVLLEGRGSMQAPTPADGPWAGWAQCVLTAQFTGQGQTYGNQQTHTWVLTSSTPGPTSSSAIKQYAATWQVTGQGTRERGQGKSEQWTTAGQPMPDTITIRLTAAGTVRIGGAAQLRSVGTTTGAVVPDIDEWFFPTIEGAATQTTISGSAPQGLLANFPGAPGGTSSTVTCSWSFVRGGGTPPPPPGPPASLARATAGPSPTTPPGTPAPLATASAGPSPTRGPLSRSSVVAIGPTIPIVLPPDASPISLRPTDLGGLPLTPRAALAALSGTTQACNHPYFPLRAGATWTFGSQLGNQVWTVQSVSGGSVAMSIAYADLTLGMNLTCDNAGIRGFGNYAIGGVAVTIVNESGVAIPTSVAAGANWDYSYETVVAGTALGVRVSISYTAGSVQEITTPAGTFAALPITGTASATTFGTPTENVTTLQTTVHLAPGVGIVHMDNNLGGLGSAASLTSYRVP